MCIENTDSHSEKARCVVQDGLRRADPWDWSRNLQRRRRSRTLVQCDWTLGISTQAAGVGPPLLEAREVGSA